MTFAAIIFAVVLAFLAFRFVTGIVKFALIAVILAVVAWFLMSGGAH